MLAETRADAIVRGEPEYTVEELCSGKPLAQVHGITWSDGGEAAHNPDQLPVKMDQLPMPSFEKLPMRRYSYEVLGDRNFWMWYCASK
jgi:hypothetical protein